jgi:hypothetical protein
MPDPAEKKKPDFICPDCNLACYIEEYGYAGGRDEEPIDCKKCGKRLGRFSTTGYTRKHWKHWK